MENRNQKKLLENIVTKLKADFEQKHLIIGFDGFIDEVIHIVDQRKNTQEYTRIKTISEYAERINRASGLSANIEMVPILEKLGGNGPIMANSLLSQDYKVSYIGSLGRSRIHDVFEEFASRCDRVISVADSAHTDALEFMDGKLMMGKMSTLSEVNWDSLLEKITPEELKELLQGSALIAFNNWTMLPHMNSIMKGMLSIMGKLEKIPGAFIDLADPQKRLDHDIKEVLELISEIGTHAPMILSMNENESLIVARLLGIGKEHTMERARKIREKLQISHVVIHPLHGAAIATHGENCWIDGPYTEIPKLTTGAGDNFNAGFCNGWLKGLLPIECLILGVYTSGYYVRKCDSPNKQELIKFIRSYL